MKQAMTIIANLIEPGLLKTLVEIIASNHMDMGYSKVAVLQRWRAIETSCTQAYVLGTFGLNTEGRDPEAGFRIPFTSSFLFTCIKDDHGSFNLEWCASLS